MAGVDMRYFAARDGSPAEYCRKRIAECDIFVSVIGFRYGSLVPGELVSYTEMEFQAASDLGLPRLVFMLDESARPAGSGDAVHGPAQQFRQRLRDAGLVVRTFTSGDGLELEVFHALSELRREWPATRAAGASRNASVPQIWNAPIRNAGFTGRDAILERIHHDLAGDGTAVVMARALYGLGGVGKTQVTLEYAHRYKAKYELVWWVNAEQPQAVTLSLAELASHLGLPMGETAAEAAAAALDQLRRDQAGRWLLVFDNAEDPADLAAFLPNGSGHVLITSRNHAWTRHAQPVELDVFTRQESVAHLLRHVPAMSTDDAAKVADAAGDLPLAVEQAAAWLAETGMPAALYIEYLTTQPSNVLGLNRPLDYARPVAATWNLSVDRLSAESPASVRLLQILAFCSPEPIAMSLLYSDALAELLAPIDEALRDKLMLGRVIRDISRFALVKVDQGRNSLQMHRLVQAVIRSRMSEEEQPAARHAVHQILQAARPREGETDDPANWATYDVIWPHLEPSGADECNDPRTRQLLIDWVRYQWKHGEFDSGLVLGRRLTELWTRGLGPDHQQTLHLQFQLANILRSQGRFSDARDLDTYVLERQREVLGTDHPHALMTANGLAADLRALGDFQQSLDLDRATLQSLTERFGTDHPRRLVAAHNLGCSLRLVGDYRAALRLDREALDHQRQVLGRDHPQTLRSAASLALDLRTVGAFRESVSLLRSTWDRYREVLGDEMLDTLDAAVSLSVSLRWAGQQAEAMDIAEDTHQRYQRRYGSQSPDALSCSLNLASNYATANRLPEALQLVTGVERAHQASLGDDHPNTLVAVNNLGCYLRHVGRQPESLRRTEDTLHRMRRKLGGSHPLALCCAINLANCLGDSGDLESAAELARQTISLLVETLGRDHPDTLICQANLAVTLHQAGREDAGQELSTRTLTTLGQILGSEHPEVIRLRRWQRIDRELEAPQI